MASGLDWRAWSPDALADRATRAATRADADLAVAIVDFFLTDAARLDERTRGAVGEAVRGIVRVTESAIRRHAARSLADADVPDKAAALLTRGPDAMVRLLRAGVLRDPALMGELIARVRQGLLAEALPVAPGLPDEPSLLVRLAAAPDAAVARTAAALLAADSQRRSAWENGQPAATELPDDLHRRLVWWVAAAIRGDDDEELDHAIVTAAERVIAAHDEGDQGDALALRLAIAIDARDDELPALLLAALGDRRPGLFTALLGHALGLPQEQARMLMLEPEGDRLWLALRAIGVDRAGIARIGLALSDADPARDIEALADQLDAIVAIGPDEARDTLAPLALPADYRAAIRALARSEA